MFFGDNHYEQDLTHEKGKQVFTEQSCFISVFELNQSFLDSRILTQNQILSFEDYGASHTFSAFLSSIEIFPDSNRMEALRRRMYRLGLLVHSFGVLHGYKKPNYRKPLFLWIVWLVHNSLFSK